MMRNLAPRLDPRALRDAFGSFMTGVTVVTARAQDGSLVGFTANSFSSVSLDPPMVLVCPGKYLSCYDVFASCREFTVNILSEGQEDISNIFASHKGDRFALVEHELSAQGLPLITGAVAQFCCATHQNISAGDHNILVGEVLDFKHVSRPALGFVSGRYFKPDLERHQDSKRPTICGAIIECDRHILLELTPKGLRPPQTETAKQGRQRDLLSAHLETHAIKGELKQLYSSFSDKTGQDHRTYFLANTTQKQPYEGYVWVAIEALDQQDYCTKALLSMMSRYALETQTGSFSLYLGDDQTGDIHNLT